MVAVMEFATLSIPTSFAMGYNIGRKGGGGLHIYSDSEISGFLERLGFSDLKTKGSSDRARNSDGTALYLFDWMKNKAVRVTCQGDVKEINLPGKPSWTSRPIWFDKDYRPVAWYEYDDGKIHFVDSNHQRDIPNAILGTNSYGPFYIKSIKSPANKDVSVGTEIFSLADPSTPVAKIMRFHGQDIFVKGEKVFVFGNYYDTHAEQHDLYIFQKTSKGLTQIDKVIIKRPHRSPAPFYVEDFCPWSDEVLFGDTYDNPFRSEFYVYNLKTGEMKSIGKFPAFGGWGIYFQCDIVKGTFLRN